MNTHFEKPPDYSPERVHHIRTRSARMSLAAFASSRKVSVSTMRRWESAVLGQRPRGAAAKLLQILESKGLGALTL